MNMNREPSLLGKSIIAAVALIVGFLFYRTVHNFFYSH